MRVNRFIPAALIIWGVINVLGCAQPPTQSAVTSSEAQKKFLDICLKEYDLKPLTKLLGRTLWIYLPIEEDILVLKATPEGPQKSSQAKETQTLNFVDGRFENGSFNLEYDISKKKSYEMSYGYTNVYTEAVTVKQNNLLTALFRTFGEVADISPDQAPEFVVLLIADVKSGIEMKSLFYFKDFMRVMTGELPQEEYQRRNAGELYGHGVIIGDWQGRHINFRDLNMREFLSEQILNRIRLKYQSSDHPPAADTENEIMTTVAQVTRYYEFSDYTSLKLNNLSTGQAFSFDKNQIPAFFVQ